MGSIIPMPGKWLKCNYRRNLLLCLLNILQCSLLHGIYICAMNELRESIINIPLAVVLPQ